MDKNIIISIKTVLFAFGLIIALYVVYRLGPILSLLLISTIIALSVEHSIKTLLSYKIFGRHMSRNFAVMFTYIVLISSVVIIFTIGLPPVLAQAQKLITGFSRYTSNIPQVGNLEVSVSDILSQLSTFSGGFLNATSTALSLIFTLLSILVVSVYMSGDWIGIKNKFAALFPGNIQKDILSTFEEIELNIGYWLKGQLLLMLIIGALSFVALVVLKIDYPLALALIAGLLEIVPIIGPMVAAVLAAIVGFTQSPEQGIGVVVAFMIIQQLENSFLVPKVMHKVSGFSPLIILIALLVGSHFFGVVGAILAVPVTMIGVIIFKRAIKYSHVGDS